MERTARDHLIHAVLPAYAEFAQVYNLRKIGNRNDTRFAATLANTLRDMADHVFFDLDDPNLLEGYKTVEEYRQALQQHFPDFVIACNLADLWKHRKLRNHRRIPNAVEDISEYNVAIIYKDDNGWYAGFRKLLLAKIDLYGNLREVGELLHTVTVMWIQQLYDTKIIGAIPELSPLPGFFMSREQAEMDGPVKIIGRVGEPVEIYHRIFFYDYGFMGIRDPKDGETFSVKWDTEIIIEEPLLNRSISDFGLSNR